MPKAGSADLAGVDGGLHARNRLEETALADHSQLYLMPRRSFDHGIAIGEAGCQRLLHQHVDSGFGRTHGRRAVRRMWSTDNYSFDVGVRDQAIEICVGAHPIPGGEFTRSLERGIGDCDKLSFRQRAESGGVQVGHFAAAHYTRADLSVHLLSLKVRGNHLA